MWVANRAEHIVTISHPWQRDTGKYAAQGPNIMLTEGPMMLPEGSIMGPEGEAI